MTKRKVHEDKEGDVNVVSPNGVHKLTEDALTVLGLFVKDRNRALAVDEVEILLVAHNAEVVSDVADVFTELEANKHIHSCPLENHDGDVRYRLS